MKKSNFILSLIMAMLGIQLLIERFGPENIADQLRRPFGLIVQIVLILVLIVIALYWKLQEAELTTKELALIAIYSAFTAASRIPFIVFPSIQPCTFLIFAMGYVFGPLIGFIVGANNALLSNFLIGQGPWTIYQMFTWGFVGIIGGLVNRNKKNTPNRTLNTLLGFALGIFYGWLMNLWFWILFISPHTWQTFFVTSLQSLPFDLLHAVGNVVFFWFFSNQTITILYRYKNRFTFKYVPPEETLGDIEE